MNSLPPSDDVWPPPVFHEVNPALGAASTRSFELVDVGAPSPGRVAAIEVEIVGPIWWLADGSALSPQLAARLIADVRIEAQRSGAARLVTRPNCAEIIVEAVRAHGGRDEGKRVVFDV